MDHIAEVMAIVVAILAAAAVLRTVIQARLQSNLAREQREIQRQLLDRLQSPQALSDLLGTEAGRKLLEVPTIEKASNFDRILSSVRIGILLISLGVAFWLVRGYMGDDGVKGFAVLAGLAIALGAGSLTSAVATFVLSKQWGLLNGKGAE